MPDFLYGAIGEHVGFICEHLTREGMDLYVNTFRGYSLIVCEQCRSSPKLLDEFVEMLAWKKAEIDTFIAEAEYKPYSRKVPKMVLRKRDIPFEYTN